MNKPITVLKITEKGLQIQLKTIYTRPLKVKQNFDWFFKTSNSVYITQGYDTAEEQGVSCLALGLRLTVLNVNVIVDTVFHSTTP